MFKSVKFQIIGIVYIFKIIKKISEDKINDVLYVL